MKIFKTILYPTYVIFLVASVLLYVYRDKLVQQFELFTLFVFLKYWLMGGLGLFVISWIIENIHVTLLKRKIHTLNDKITALKAKIYDNSVMQQTTQYRLATSPDKEGKNK